MWVCWELKTTKFIEFTVEMVILTIAHITWQCCDTVSFLCFMSIVRPRKEQAWHAFCIAIYISYNTFPFIKKVVYLEILKKQVTSYEILASKIHKNTIKGDLKSLSLSADINQIGRERKPLFELDTFCKRLSAKLNGTYWVLAGA